jgi:hypothetical protein
MAAGAAGGVAACGGSQQDVSVRHADPVATCEHNIRADYSAPGSRWDFGAPGTAPNPSNLEVCSVLQGHARAQVQSWIENTMGLNYPVPS